MISTCPGQNSRKSGLRAVIRAGITWQRWPFRVRVLKSGFHPSNGVGRGWCESGEEPPTFRANVDDKLALITKTGTIPEKGVGGHLPAWRTGRSFEDHLTLELRD
jgi:hypothetical protein